MITYILITLYLMINSFLIGKFWEDVSGQKYFKGGKLLVILLFIVALLPIIIADFIWNGLGPWFMETLQIEFWWSEFKGNHDRYDSEAILRINRRTADLDFQLRHKHIQHSLALRHFMWLTKRLNKKFNVKYDLDNDKMIDLPKEKPQPEY